MKNSTPSEKQYIQVQELLLKTFKAEKMYFEAAEDVQITSLQRYLYHQSTIRNKFCFELSEELIFNNVEPVLRWIEKGKLNRSGMDIKNVLLNKHYIPLLQDCLDLDYYLADLCRALLKSSTLPINVLEAISHQLTSLLFENLEALDLIKELSKPKKENRDSKVIALNGFATTNQTRRSL